GRMPAPYPRPAACSGGGAKRTCAGGEGAKGTHRTWALRAPNCAARRPFLLQAVRGGLTQCCPPRPSIFRVACRRCDRGVIDQPPLDLEVAIVEQQAAADAVLVKQEAQLIDRRLFAGAVVLLVEIGDRHWPVALRPDLGDGFGRI